MTLTYRIDEYHKVEISKIENILFSLISDMKIGKYIHISSLVDLNNSVDKLRFLLEYTIDDQNIIERFKNIILNLSELDEYIYHNYLITNLEYYLPKIILSMENKESIDNKMILPIYSNTTFYFNANNELDFSRIQNKNTRDRANKLLPDLNRLFNYLEQ